MPAPKVLIYVEDPGAANMVLGLSKALEELGATPRLLTGGAAENYLLEQGEKAEPLSFPRNLVALIQGARPDVFVMGTAEDPDTPAFALAQAAKDAGVPTVCLIDGPANADKRLKGRGRAPLTHLTDWLFVPDESTRDEFRTLGVDAARIRVVGNPAFDRVPMPMQPLSPQDRQELRTKIFPDLQVTSPLILFLTELSDGLDTTEFRRNADYTLHGRGSTDGRTEIVLEEVLDAAATVPDARVALRLHPKTPQSLYADYMDEIAGISANGTPYDALQAADLVVGLSTALLTEAALMDCPVLSVLPRAAETRWLSGGADMIPHVTTREGLRDALPHALSDPQGFMAGRSKGFARRGAPPRIARALAAVAIGALPAPDGTVPYIPPRLETERLVLEPFSEDLLTDRYVGWLNDPEVVMYSEQRHTTHSIESCRTFIDTFAGTSNALWGIREKEHGLRHIGNISTEVDLKTGTGDIRILVGEREVWGTGIGAEAWTAVMAHLFDDLGLARVTAGTLEENRGMIKIMEKSGMLETHRLPAPTRVDGRAMDMIYACRLACDWHGLR